MSREVNVRRGFFLAIVGLLFAASQTAVASPGRPRTRSVIVFDNSGSMRQNDPQRLAEAATMLYIQLSKPTDEVGLVVFSNEGRMAVPLGPVSTQGRKIARRLSRLRLNGARTDIGDGLEAALRALGPPQPDARDVVVLLTDGMVDLGVRAEAEHVRSNRWLRTEVVGRYLRRKTPLYTIAFTPSADRKLLNELAAGTHGSFRYIKNASALHRAFTELFTVASGAIRLPVRDGLVVVDPSIKQTSLVISKPTPNTANTLITPAEEVIKAGSLRKGLEWTSSPSYDLVNMNKPEAGSWQMVGADGKAANGVAIVKESRLVLKVRFGPQDVTIDDVLQLQAELVEDGKRVDNYVRLKTMVLEARIEGPAGERKASFKSTEVPGLYTARFAQTAEGLHRLWVTALSPTLQRQWQGSYTVKPKCFEHQLQQVGAQMKALVRMRPRCPSYIDITPEVSRHVAGSKLEWLPMVRGVSGTYERTLAPLVDGASGVARIRIRATTEDGYAVAVVPPPMVLPSAEREPWLQVVATRLAYINAPLLVLGLIVILAKMRQRKPDGGAVR
ncbi:MAG: vWA domain-containing protein [Myxococcota bacterium]